MLQSSVGKESQNVDAKENKILKENEKERVVHELNTL